MKKILVLMMGALCLLSCTKQYITEEHIHGKGYCTIDEMFSNTVASASYTDFDNVAIWAAGGSGKGTRDYGFDTIRFIKKDKTNVLHLVRTLQATITPKTYDFETNLMQYDTTYYWYNNNPDYPNDVFNFYIKQESDDEVEAYSRYRQVRVREYTDEYTFCRGRGYFTWDLDLEWDSDRSATITVKDTIIDIACPHEEIEREYYYHKYSE